MIHAYPLSAASSPLFGSPWLVLIATLAVVALVMVFIAVAGRKLAAGHPEAPPAPAPSSAPAVAQVTPSAADMGVSLDIQAVIAAAVVHTLGRNARVAEVREEHNPNVETLMVQWAMEGRREIYTSHRLR